MPCDFNRKFAVDFAKRVKLLLKYEHMGYICTKLKRNQKNEEVTVFLNYFHEDFQENYQIHDIG